MVWGQPAPIITPPATTTPSTPSTPTPLQPGLLTPETLGFSTTLPTGYRQQDLGDGRYEVFNANNESMGYTYKGVRDAIGDISYRNAQSRTTNADGVWTNPLLQVSRTVWQDVNGQEVDISGLSRVQAWGENGAQDQFYRTNDNGENEQVVVNQADRMENQRFNSQEDIDRALERYRNVGNYNGVMGDWEALGQVLEGNVAPNPQEWGNLPTDNREQTIRGTGMLYGSTAVFDNNGRIIGYRTDLTPNNEARDFSNGTDTVNQEEFGTFIRHDGRSHDWNNANWRELSDPNAWRTNAVVGEGGNAFIPVENLDNLSWTNRDSYRHQDTRANWGFSDIMGDIARYTDPIFYNSIGGEDFYDTAGQEGIYAAVFDRLDPILDKIDPGHNATQNAITNAIGADSQRDAFQRIAPIMVAIFAPYGAAINAANSAQQGNYAAAATAIAGQLLSGVDFGGAAANAGASSTLVDAIRAVSSGNIATMTGGLIDFGSTSVNQIVGRAVTSAARNGVAAGLSGADLEDALKTALVSAAGSLVGSIASSTASSNGLGQNTSNVIGSAAGAITTGAINNATRPDTPDATTRPPSGGSTSSPQPTPTPTVQPLAGRVARMVWS
jgi:hypothetical protein